MPWSIFDHGRHILRGITEGMDPAAREAVERDRKLLFESPTNHGLVTWPWKGEDDVPWQTRITLLGERVLVRYALVPGYSEPAIITATDADHI